MQDPSTALSKKERALTTYQKAKLQHTETLKLSMIEAAASILQESGAEAVTIRKVAEKMECPTKVIYNLFGSKEGLVKELFLEGCTLLAAEFQAVPKQQDLKLYLYDLGQAYWEFSQKYTSYYRVMFGGAFSEFKPEEESLQTMVTALEQVNIVVAEAMEQGLMAKEDPNLVVGLIWASLHGVIDLYLGGHLPGAAAAQLLYEKSISGLTQTLFVQAD
ncbi:TetR/AcrR family transcriptional regulator [Saccharibacillus qingshengii]|uniref:TetR/AcrR family transcriptional regulator n=1 Tax=Saccharibacillus qingshengii TaxID=1763540 RepID=UPI001551C739|nr:TetR/AcrR family transcriptional regulator [Saccharibacillus qingshengii]